MKVVGGNDFGLKPVISVGVNRKKAGSLWTCLHESNFVVVVVIIVVIVVVVVVIDVSVVILIMVIYDKSTRVYGNYSYIMTFVLTRGSAYCGK